ncbi:MAG: hypothetical protein PHU64_06980 [Candidatus Omnitrophica bacterium]|nr:hypothetical protein [Candidatus Omnitrophota bacterium]MDD5430484.1 hypothetical protein [Candidatus Omnitrophota bacterium]
MKKIKGILLAAVFLGLALTFLNLNKANTEEQVYIPSDWGSLKGVSSHGSADLLYFEANDGTIHAIRLVLVGQEGGYFFKKTAVVSLDRQ